MAGYSRKTSIAPSRVLERADEALPRMLGVTRSKASGHGATYSGAEGTVTLAVHRHGPFTEVVASTDRLRTSRMDYEVQKFLKGMDYPASREDLIRHAEQQGADENIRRSLEQLPGDRFETPAEVSQAIGRLE